MNTPPMDRLRQACPDLVDRFMEVDACCIIWTGARDAKGYGRAYVNDQTTTLAHRVVYQRLHGPVAGALAVDHRCAVKACVNPDHLEAVAHGENVRRAAQRRRELAAQGKDVAGCCANHALGTGSTRRRRRDPGWLAVEERHKAYDKRLAALGLSARPPTDIFEALGKPRFLSVRLPREKGKRQMCQVIDLLHPTVHDLVLLTGPGMREQFDGLGD